MLCKVLIVILILAEQLSSPSCFTDYITKTINKVEEQKSSTVFLLVSKETAEEEINKSSEIEKDKEIINLPLLPLPIKKQNASIFNPTASSVCALDLGTARLLFAKEKDRRLPIASLTKVMTAFIILKDNKLDGEVTIKESSIKVGAEESQMGLTLGDKIKVRDLLYSLIVYSANDGARALAEYKSGSEKKFTELMNREAEELGLKNTHFVNASGMDAEDQYSTAYDLALLTKCVAENPLFLQMINTKQYSFISGNGTPYLLTNTDELLGADSRIIGGKTGSTEQAGRCLTSLASENKHQIITVVLNCPDRFEETKRLLDWIYTSYTW
jgi:serine-type D-Ala-D-Ala carboxypeptidase (penicillin-binding protein 5/6)